MCHIVHVLVHKSCCIHQVLGNILTNKAMYKVINIDPKYAAVNGNLPSEQRCFTWFIGPQSKEKLEI